MPITEKKKISINAVRKTEEMMKSRDIKRGKEKSGSAKTFSSLTVDVWLWIFKQRFLNLQIWKVANVYWELW